MDNTEDRIEHLHTALLGTSQQLLHAKTTDDNLSNMAHQRLAELDVAIPAAKRAMHTSDEDFADYQSLLAERARLMRITGA